MTPGRDFDLAIAREVMGHPVQEREGQWFETTGAGLRPLGRYSSELEAAFEVARKLGVTLIPVEGGQWFAFVGPRPEWKSPAEFLQHLGQADFARSGAAVAESPAFSICVAAYNAIQQRAVRAPEPKLPDNVIGLTH